MAGTMIEFPSNGKAGSGYLAVPASGGGPGVIVLQEWWGWSTTSRMWQVGSQLKGLSRWRQTCITAKVRTVPMTPAN